MMVYQGGKQRLAKHICPIINRMIRGNKIQTYIEPFGGGANIIQWIEAPKRIYYDINPYLCKLLTKVRDYPEMDWVPDPPTREEYEEIKHRIIYTEPALYGLYGYCASYSGKYWAGWCTTSKRGSQWDERIRNLRDQAPRLAGVEIQCRDFFDLTDIHNAVIYCDPPYKGTTGYRDQSFDHDRFYDRVEELARDNIVLISEQWMPPDRFTSIWEAPVSRSIGHTGKKALEHLYMRRLS